jgi:hypothetical protein
MVKQPYHATVPLQWLKIGYRLQKLILILEGKVMFEDWHSPDLYLGSRVSPRKGEYIRGH